jgi:hypothetical protein
MTATKNAARLLRRLSQASWAELRFRGAQMFLNHWDGLLYRLGFAALADGITRRAGRQAAAPRFFFSGAELPVLVEILQQRLPETARETVTRAERVCAHRFDLLGYKNLDLGRLIDWHLDPVHNKRAPDKIWYEVPYLDFDAVGDVKIIWELNRHQHFVTLGKAYQLTREEKYTREFVAQFYEWQAHNPYPAGVNWASSLEVAFRSLSWIWARELFAGASSFSEKFQEDLLAALERNAKFIERNLSFYFSPNTHLLGEGVALFFIGVLFPELRAASRWRERGWRIVLEAARRQVRKDGGYFEQSTYYHVYALDFFLHARILASWNRIPIPDEFDQTVLAMLEYLAALGTAGPPPSFGDDDGGRLFDPSRNRTEHLLDPLSTGSVLYARPDFKAAAGQLREETLWLLGPGSAGEFDRMQKVASSSHSQAFPATGTYILASEGLRLAMDAGPLGSARGGHGHADALSVCVAADGSSWIGDQGTFTYTGSREARDQFRGTRAHNTLVVDGLDQADIVDPFAWGRFPQVSVERWITGETFDLLEASHDGYARLAPPVRHRRLVFFVKDRFWLVVDAMEGQGHRKLEILWHGPPAGFELDAAHRALAVSNSSIDFAVVPALNPAWSVNLADASWSPSYGAKESRRALRCHAETNLPAEFATLLVPRVASRDALGILSSMHGNRLDVRGYEYVTSAGRSLWVLADSSEPWQLGEFSSDSRVAYIGLGGDGRIENVVLCEGSFLAVGNEKFLDAGRARHRIEYRRANGREEVIPAGAAQVCHRERGNASEMAPAAALVRDASDRTQQ